jgi:hypothetical protein
MSHLQRRSASKTPPPGVIDERLLREDLAAYPALLEFLTAESWPDGAARRTGTLLLFHDDYRIKLCLADRDQSLVLFVTCDSLTSCLQEAEEALCDPRSDWRPAKNSQPRRSGK